MKIIRSYLENCTYVQSKDDVTSLKQKLLRN
jgi:hypothetical protein